MPDLPIQYGPGLFTDLPQVGSTVTAHASNNTKGSYTELVTSLGCDVSGLWIILNSSSGTTRFLVDLAIGSAGSEVVIGPDLVISNGPRQAQWYHLPVSLPEGTRIAARCQSTTGGSAISVFVAGIRTGLQGPPAGGQIRSLCTDTATTDALHVDPGAVVSTYGPWVTANASLPADVVALFPVVTNLSNAAPTSQSATFKVDIGVGGAGSEVVIVDGLRFTSSTGGGFGPLPTMWLPVSVAAGSRVAVRGLAALTDATDRKFGIALYALTI